MTDAVVSNDREYRAALERVFKLMVGDPAADTPEGEELVRLAVAVEKFEAERYPISCCAFAAIECAERLLALLRRLGQLYELERAIRWCESPQPLLEGQRPVNMVMTEKGGAEVDAVVARLLDGTHI